MRGQNSQTTKFLRGQNSERVSSNRDWRKKGNGVAMKRKRNFWGNPGNNNLTNDSPGLFGTPPNSPVKESNLNGGSSDSALLLGVEGTAGPGNGLQDSIVPVLDEGN